MPLSINELQAFCRDIHIYEMADCFELALSDVDSEALTAEATTYATFGAAKESLETQAHNYLTASSRIVQLSQIATKDTTGNLARGVIKVCDILRSGGEGNRVIGKALEVLTVKPFERIAHIANPATGTLIKVTNLQVEVSQIHVRLNRPGNETEWRKIK